MAKSPMNQHKSMAMGKAPKLKAGAEPAFKKGGSVTKGSTSSGKPMARKGVVGNKNDD